MNKTRNSTDLLKKSSYRPEIDGLRAFAVIAVIINHFNKEVLPGGYLGVDIFFVISGYVITSSLYNRPSENFKDFISGFYERRIKRIVPALSIFLLITGFLICLFNPEANLSLKTGIASAFGLSNIYLLKQSTDYFGVSTELNVFTHTWSLGVEEQFYILFPFLIWFSGLGRQSQNGARNMFFIVGALTIASLIGYLYLYQTNQPAAYFLMPSRFWEMAAGCLIFIGFQKRASIKQFLEQVPPLLVLGLIVGLMYFPKSYAASTTVSVVTLSSILLACLKPQTTGFKILTNAKVIYIGLISYSLYLWHWGVISISRWTIGIHWWSVPFQAALMLGLAAASYHWIETPLRRGTWFNKRWITLGIGAVAIFATSGLTMLLTKKGSNLFIGEMPNNREPGKGYGWNTKHCAIFYTSSYIPTNLKTAVDKCWLKEVKTKNNLTEQRKDFNVYAYGNSYTHQLVPAYRKIQDNHPSIAFNIFSSACPATSYPITSSTDRDEQCKDLFSNYIKHFIKDSKKGDILIIAESLGAYSHSNKKILKNPAISSTSQWQNMHSKELLEISAMLNKQGKHLFYVSGIPHLNGEPIACGQWYSALNNTSACNSFSDLSIDQKKPFDSILAMAKGGIIGIDIYTEFTKKVKNNDRSLYELYFDKTHINSDGALLVEPLIRQSISQAINK